MRRALFELFQLDTPPQLRQGDLRRDFVMRVYAKDTLRKGGVFRRAFLCEGAVMLLIELFTQRFARVKTGRFGCGNVNFCAGAGIPAFACGTILYFKNTEAADVDSTIIFERDRDFIKQVVDYLLRQLFRSTAPCGYLGHQIAFVGHTFPLSFFFAYI